MGQEHHSYRQDSSQSTASCENKKTSGMWLVSDLLGSDTTKLSTHPIPACPELAAPSTRTAADHLPRLTTRTKKSLFLKRLSSLCPELGRERAWLTKRNMNRNQKEDRLHATGSW